MGQVSEERVTVSAEQLGIQPGQEYEGQLEFDLGNLMACDPSPVDTQTLEQDPEAHCLEMATKITQSLVAQLFSLPGQAAPIGRVVHLPPPTTQLPRQKPLPTPRPPTRWEKFAQEKGIQKKKRSVKVWDEDNQEWRRRFGYQRAGDTRDISIVEAKASDQVGEDPFSEMKKEKRERVKASGKRELANKKTALKAGGKGAVPSTLKLASTLPEHGKGRPVKRKELKDDIRSASRQAGVSTASMGKFDKRLEGEKEGERLLGRKRRKFEPVAGKTSQELSTATGLVDKILRERADDILDIDRAVRAVGKVKSADEDAAASGPKRRSKSGGKGAKGRGGKQNAAKLGVKGSKVGGKKGQAERGGKRQGAKPKGKR